MNIGGLHIFGGLFFLLLCSAITFGYTLVLYLFYVVSKCIILEKSTFWRNVSKKFLFVVMALILLVNLVIYAHERKEWLTEENHHLEAKEYWVAGRVIYAPRKILGLVFHPESFLVQPYLYLQKRIYNVGIQYLPDTDGERYVWFNNWFLDHYSHSDDVRPSGVGDDKLELKMTTLLDSYWETLEGMMSHPISDSKMNEMYLLSFPFAVDYYSTFQGHYTGPFQGHGRRTINHPVYQGRNYKLLEWLDEIDEKWIRNDLIEEVWREYPYVASIKQFSINEVVQRICLSLPLAGEFSCDHPMVKRMYKEFYLSMSPNPKENAFLNLRNIDPETASMSYRFATYGATGSAGNYLLTEVCGKEMPKEKYVLVNKNDTYNSFWEADGVLRVFRKEFNQFK